MHGVNAADEQAGAVLIAGSCIAVTGKHRAVFHGQILNDRLLAADGCNDTEEAGAAVLAPRITRPLIHIQADDLFAVAVKIALECLRIAAAGSISLVAQRRPDVGGKVDIGCELEIFLGVGLADSSAVDIRGQQRQLLRRGDLVGIGLGAGAAGKGSGGVICPKSLRRRFGRGHHRQAGGHHAKTEHKGQDLLFQFHPKKPPFWRNRPPDFLCRRGLLRQFPYMLLLLGLHGQGGDAFIRSI